MGGLSVTPTRVDVRFLVLEDAIEGVDCHPSNAAEVWRTTSEEDWELC